MTETEKRYEQEEVEKCLEYLDIALEKNEYWRQIGANCTMMLIRSVYNAPTEECAWDLLNATLFFADAFDDEVYHDYYAMTAEWIVSNFDRDSLLNEFYLHDLFDLTAQTIMPDCSIVKKKHDNHNIPDRWVQKGNSVIPVEIKRGNFNNTCLKQLYRYMSAYDVNCGIAVGAKYTANPDNRIKFITIDEMVAARDAMAS